MLSIFSCGVDSDIKSVETIEGIKYENKKMDVNPAFYLGSDFGNYFQVLYLQEKYDLMLQHTSLKSIEKHGRDNVIAFYKNMQFAHMIKLDNINQTTDSTYTMNYVINQMATRKMWRLEVEIENDSIKVVLPSKLKDF